MKNFTPTSQSNPCQFCEDTKGNCRHGGDIHLCMGLNSNRKFEVINQHKIIDFTKDGLWAVLKLDDSEEWKEEKRQEWLEERKAKEERKASERQEKLKNPLPIDKRNAAYRRITAKLNLSPNHTIQLREKRGLTATEIDFAYQMGWLRTWNRGLEVDASGKLAGVDPTSHKLLGDQGIGIAATNGNHKITGFQIASDDREKFAKYFWLSSEKYGGSSPHLPNGELPLFIWKHPQAKEINEVWLVEGALKSLITVLKLWLRNNRTDVMVIGAAGGNFAGSYNTLKDALVAADCKTIKLQPDAGAVSNSHITGNYKKILNLLITDRYKCSVGWWGQFTKDKPDIDELQDFSTIKDISPSEYFSLGKKNDIFDNESQSLDDDWEWEKWLKSRKFTPDRVVHQKEFTIDNIPKSGVIIAVNSGLGTGKTNFLIYQIKESRKRGKGSVIIGYRNNLLLQTGERALKQKVPIYHIHQDEEARLLVPDESSNHMMCLDSIHHIDGYFKGKDIYLDETVSVLLHAVNGGTLGDSQAKALRIFKKALQDCDRIFLLDGNLADLYVKFIDKIAGNKRVIKVKNTQKIPPHNIYIVDGINEDGEIKKRDRSPLIQFLLKPDVKPWIFCDSKERTKVLYKLLTDLGRKGYVLNSETTGEDWAKKFLSDPDKFIADKKPDFMLLSPSGDSGLSSTLKQHFTHKFSFFSGVLGTNSQHQSMFRLRDDGIPHYVFCPEFSTVRNRSNPSNYSINQLKDTLNNRILQSALLATDCSDNPQKALEIISQALNRNDPDWYGFSLEMMALDNHEMDNLRKCLIHALKEAGHNVEVAEWETVDKVKEAEKKAKDEVQTNHSKEVFEAVEFKSIEEANKKAKASPNKATQRRIEKTRLLDRLPNIQNSPVWSTDFIHHCHIKNRDFIRQQERYWLLKNYDISQKRHESIWNYAALGEDFFSRNVSAMGHDVIWALNELNLLSFTETDKLINKNSPEVVQIVKTLRERSNLQLALRISRLEPETVDGKERLRILNNLLEIIGFKTRCTGRKIIKTDDGTIRLRHYHAIPNAVRNVLQNSPASTPPHIYIDSQGCGRSQIPYTDKLLSHIDPELLHQAIRSGNVCASTPPHSKITASTPPHIYIDSQGCRRSQTPSNNKQSSHFDLVAARQAILNSIEYKFTQWMNSDKSKVKWEVEAEEKPITQFPMPIPQGEWEQPEAIADVASMLEYCQNGEMLADLRSCDIPVSVLKLAARQLPLKNAIEYGNG